MNALHNLFWVDAKIFFFNKTLFSRVVSPKMLVDGWEVATFPVCKVIKAKLVRSTKFETKTVMKCRSLFDHIAELMMGGITVTLFYIGYFNQGLLGFIFVSY